MGLNFLDCSGGKGSMEAQRTYLQGISTARQSNREKRLHAGCMYSGTGLICRRLLGQAALRVQGPFAPGVRGVWRRGTGAQDARRTYARGISMCAAQPVTLHMHQMSGVTAGTIPSQAPSPSVYIDLCSPKRLSVCDVLISKPASCCATRTRIFPSDHQSCPGC